MQNEKINPEEAYKTLMVIWFALLMSQAMFIVLLFFVKPALFAFDLSNPPLGDNAILVIALSVASIVNFAISLVLRKKYLEQAIREQKIEHVQTALIFGCALCESISLFGLLLAFTADYQYFFLFFALGIFGIMVHFPRRENIHAASFKQG